jgi:hypothetical protein
VVAAARSLEEMGRAGRMVEAEPVWRSIRNETDRLVETLQRVASA